MTVRLPPLRSLGRVSAREWLDLGRASLALGYAGAALLLRGRGRLLLCEVSPRQESDPTTAGSALRVTQLEQALARAVRYSPVRPKCLVRSMALHRLLQRAGIRGSRIRIGVQSGKGGMMAHAWVTLADRVLGDDPQFVARFTEITDATMAGIE